VAGLAHGVKNILTGLEGGLYLMQTGLQKGKNDRVEDGFSMLNRNIERISHFVRTLLDFSRGREPEVERIDPTVIAHEVVALFSEAAASEQVKLKVVRKDTVEPAPFDPEGIHTCLANLVTNAVDACCLSDRPKNEVVIRIYEEPDDYPFRTPPDYPPTCIVIEVADNGIGMDYEVKQKVFTNFFTTKGEGEGTGLGLLETRKIVQEHGGTISMETKRGKGTTFKMTFPRRRLPTMTHPNERNQSA
jgi:signal transduction histidine kinase